MGHIHITRQTRQSLTCPILESFFQYVVELGRVTAHIERKWVTIANQTTSKRTGLYHLPAKQFLCLASFWCWYKHKYHGERSAYPPIHYTSDIPTQILVAYTNTYCGTVYNTL